MTQEEATTEATLYGDPKTKLWLRGYQDRMLNLGKPKIYDEYTRGWLSAESVCWHQEIQLECAEMRERLYAV